MCNILCTLFGSFETTHYNNSSNTYLPKEFLLDQCCVKSIQIRSYFWSVPSCIQSEYRKILIRNNSVFGRFSRSAMMHHYSKLQLLLLPYLILHYLILHFLMRHCLILNYFKIVLFDIPLFLCWTIYCGTISKLYYLMFHYFHVVLFNVPLFPCCTI